MSRLTTPSPTGPFCLLALGLLALLGACHPKPLAIGLVGTLSGRQSELAVSGRDGALMRIEEENAKPGNQARPIVLLAQDDLGTEEGFRKAEAALAAASVRIVIGPFLSSMGESASTPSQPLVYLSPTISSDRFSGKDDALLRLMASNVNAARAMADFIENRLGIHRILVLKDESNAAYADDYVQSLEAALAQGGDPAVVDTISVPGFDQASYAATAGEIMARKPQFLMIIAGGPDAAMVFRQLSRLGYTGVRAVSGWTVTSDFACQGGEVTEGVYFSHQYNHGDKSPSYRRFLEAYKDRYGREPSFSAVYSYEAADLALELLEAGPRASAAELKAAALASGVHQGLQDRWSFNSTGDAVRPAGVYRFKDGEVIHQ